MAGPFFVLARGQRAWRLVSWRAGGRGVALRTRADAQGGRRRCCGTSVCGRAFRGGGGAALRLCCGRACRGRRSSVAPVHVGGYCWNCQPDAHKSCLAAESSRSATIIARSAFFWRPSPGGSARVWPGRAIRVSFPAGIHVENRCRSAQFCKTCCVGCIEAPEGREHLR